MGLDVYLYHYSRPVDEGMKIEELTRKKVDEFRTALEKEMGLGDDWGKVSKKKKDEYYRRLKKWYAENGLNEYGEIPEGEVCEKIELDSEKHPNHLFKIGYFRSSYNDNGINRILQNRLGGKTLHWMFDAGEEYVVEPDWHCALERAKQVLEEFRNYVGENGSYGVMTCRGNDFISDSELPGSEEKALSIFNEERKRSENWDPEMKNFGNRNGEFFFGEPLSVVAMVSGTCGSFTSGSPKPCTYVIYDNKEGMDWYVSALEVVVETCEWVLRQEDDPRQYVLHWSG